MSDLPFGKPERAPRKRDKTAEKRQTYKELRFMFLREHRWCKPAECQGPNDPYPNRATEIHHSAGRVGDAYLDTTTWVECCHECHALIHDKPEWAREQGWSRSRHG